MAELTRFTLKQRPPQGPKPEPWLCPKCGLVEPLLLPTGRWIERTCACQRQAKHERLAKEAREVRLRDMAKRTFGGWLGDAWADRAVGSRALATRSFTNFVTNRNPSLAPALKVAETFACHPQGTLLCYGPCGVGKTHLLAAICNALREQDPSVPSLFASTPAFFSAFYDRMDEGDEWKLIKQAINTPFLVIDDLDKASPKPFRQEVYYQIIDERVKAGRPIGVSTNDMPGLEGYIGKASYSRLMVDLTPVKMLGDDYRRSLMRVVR